VGTSGVVASQSLGDGTIEFPDLSSAGGTLTNGSYQYRVVWFTNDAGTPNESAPSAAINHDLTGANCTIRLSNLPVDVPATSIWDGRRVYRSDDGGATFSQVGPDLNLTDAIFNDTGFAAGAALNASNLEQEEYSYYVTFYSTTGNIESRPTELIGPFSIDNNNSRIRIDDLPQPTGTDGFNKVRIYRNLGNAPTQFHMVDELDLGTTSYIDAKSDGDISSSATLDLLGAKASATTLLSDVVIRTGNIYTQPFVEGTLTFQGSKGGRTLAAKTLTITSTTTVGDLRTFMQQAYGIDTSLTDGAGSTLNSDGQLVFTSNAGQANELGANLGSFSMKPTGGQSTPISLNFGSVQPASGQGTTATFVVYDALGEPIDVRLTTVREEQAPGTTGTTYRWFATSEDNEPFTGVETFLGSGQIVFDLDGNIISPAGGQAQIAISHPAQRPLIFNLDFNAISGLAVTDAQSKPVNSMSLTRQDGFAAGTLTSFTITESGLIRGVFSNGAERPLGQILMAKFANPGGLQQVGTNLFSQGVNSGEPVIDIPGSQGMGTLTAGAVELSNSDIGQNLIELILASTQYRGGARVITTAQQLLEELLNLRR
jgi:flagellar hook protein FlgE